MPTFRARGEADGIHARLSDGTPVVGDLLLVATGRRPSTAGIGLAAAGVEVAGESGRVVVDEYGRTRKRRHWPRRTVWLIASVI